MAVNIINTKDTADTIISLIDDYNVLVDLRNQTGVILHLSYLKGDETALNISHSVGDFEDPNDLFYDIVERDSDGILKKFISIVTDSSNILYPVAVVLPNTKVKINFEFVGATSEGSLEIFSKVDNPSYKNR